MNATLLCTLLLLCNPPQPVPEDPEQILKFLAAQQINTAAIYDTLSYDAVVKRTTKEDFSPDPIQMRVVFHYSRRGSTLLLTVENSHMIHEIEQRVNGKVVDPVFEVKNTPIVNRLLFTDDLVLSWPDMATPRLQIYYESDWRESELGFRQRLPLHGKEADLNFRCLGQFNSFHELLATSPDYVKWEALPGDNGEYEVKRKLLLPDDKVQDLTLLLDARSGLCTKTKFQPKDGSLAECNVEYTTFDYRGTQIRVPKHYSSTELNPAGNLVEETEITFSDFRDESDLPPYTLGDIGLPEEIDIRRVISPTKIKFLQWKGGELKESPDSKPQTLPAR